MVDPVVSAAAMIWTIEVMKRVVDAVQHWDADGIPFLMYIIVWISLTWLLTKIVSYQRGASRVRPLAWKNLSKSYLEKYLHLDHTHTELLWTGRTITILEKWIWSRADLINRVHWDLIGMMCKILFSLVVVFFIDPWYAFGILILISVILVVYIKLQMIAFDYRRSRHVLYIDYMRDFVKIIMSKFETLQSDNFSRDTQWRDASFQKRIDINYYIEMTYAWWEIFAVIIIDALKLIAIASVTYGTIFGNISIAEFVALLAILRTLESITYRLSKFYIDFMKTFVYVEKMRNLYDDIPLMKWYYEGDEFTYTEWAISIQWLTFGYQSIDLGISWEKDEDVSTRWYVFRDFSLEISWGKKVAFVGVSWSWKSTLVKLIAWYLRPEWWSIIIDNQHLNDLSLKSYYAHVWYLTQEPSVFDGTIWDNLTYALDIESPWDDDLEKNVTEAIRLAKCEFIYEFSDGLQTEIGEKWIRLSWGQRQRLAIAKIFLKDPKILILDEPTSALDSFSEEAITEAMHNLFSWRTVIIIAHRLQTVKEADEIVVIGKEEDKRQQKKDKRIDTWSVILERGTHEELVKRWWDYAKMLELQSTF